MISICSKALASIADRIDELVVLDGAYEWMAPWLIVKADSSPAFHAPALRKQLRVQIWVGHNRTFDRFRIVV